METRLRRFFSKRRIPRDKDQLLKASPYQNTAVFKEPKKEANQVFGNGPDEVQALHIGEKRVSQSSIATAFKASAQNTALDRRRLSSERPQTAPHSVSGSNHGAERGAYALTSTVVYNSVGRETFGQRRPSLKISYQSLRQSGSLRPDSNCGQSDTLSQHTRCGTNYVDLLDAAAIFNPSRTPDQRTKASGMRNYGEDVADRNIVKFGSADLNTFQVDYFRKRYSTVEGVRIKKEGKLHSTLAYDRNFDDINENDSGYGVAARSKNGQDKSDSPGNSESVNSRPKSPRVTASRIFPFTKTTATQKSTPESSIHESTSHLSPRRNSVASTTSYISSRREDHPTPQEIRFKETRPKSRVSGSGTKATELYATSNKNEGWAVPRMYGQNPANEPPYRNDAPTSRFTVSLQTIRKRERAQGLISPLAAVLPISSARRKSKVYSVDPGVSSESIASGIDIPISRASHSSHSIVTRIKRTLPYLERRKTEIEATEYNSPASPSSSATTRHRRASDISVDSGLDASFLQPVSIGFSSSTSSPPQVLAVGEESLLFNESGYGLGGMLPGLEEPTPTSLPTSFAQLVSKDVISQELGTDVTLGRKPSQNLKILSLTDMEKEATIAATRRVKGERKRAREKRTYAAKQQKPPSLKEESEEFK